MPENHPDERIQHSEHSKSLKSSTVMNIYSLTIYLVFVICSSCFLYNVTVWM